MRTDDSDSACSEVMLPTFGIVPENALPPRRRAVREPIDPRTLGRLPESDAGCAAKSSKAVRLPNEGGSVPPTDVEEMSRPVSFVRPPISEGIVAPKR